jgi:OTU domain-containing protein 6
MFCLFSAIAHQLSLLSVHQTTSQVRLKAFDYIVNHKESFLPFVTIEFDDYCRQLKKDSWGSHLEIEALANAYKVKVRVIQSDSHDIVIGSEQGLESKEIILSYHKHEFGLGEHFNSVYKK